MIRNLVYLCGHSFFLVLGYVYYLITGRNTERGYQALVYLFCRTGGRFNAWMTWLQGKFAAPLSALEAEGVLGSVTNCRSTLLPQLQDQGYITKLQALPEEMCARLMQFAMTTPAIVRPMDGEAKGGPGRREIFDPKNPLAVRYDYPVNDLLANPDVQNLMADPSLLALAESYLGTAPRLDVVSMWWHTGFHDQPDSEAAQMYHFDMDRFRWLKVFIYLTDVGLENGPHSFVRGTHHVGSIPQRFLHRGYVRLTDKEVLDEYGAEKEIVFTAPRGTIIAEDTAGLHKGGVVLGGPRLILQLQFSGSLFGAPYPKSRLPEHKTDRLDRMIVANPAVYEGYL